MPSFTYENPIQHIALGRIFTFDSEELCFGHFQQRKSQITKKQLA